MQDNKIVNNKDILKNMIMYCNKFFYAFYFPFVLLMLFFVIWYINKFSLIFMIIIYVIIIVLWIIKLSYIPKNQSGKYGILIVVDNNNFYNEEVVNLFRKLKSTLNQDFSVVIFNKNFIRNFDKKNKTENMLSKKNYHMMLNYFSLEGQEDSEHICSLSNNGILVLTPVLNNITSEKLKSDFNNSFKKIMKLRAKNSHKDILENADLLSLSIRYFVSIIYIIFNNYDKAKNELDYMDFSELPFDDKIVKYLRRNRVFRYIDVYFAKAKKIIDGKKYLYDDAQLNKLISIEQQLQIYIDSVQNVSDIEYENNDIKSKLLFAQSKYQESYHCLNLMHNKKSNDYAVSLSMAFILINLGEIKKGVELYKKIFKKSNVAQIDIDECIKFIDCALLNNQHNKLYLNLSKGLLLYYWNNKDEGKKIINSVYNKLNREDIKNYIKPRFITKEVKKHD